MLNFHKINISTKHTSNYLYRASLLVIFSRNTRNYTFLKHYDEKIKQIEYNKTLAEEIFLVTFSGSIAGCDNWDYIELFGNTKIDYLRRYLPFINGPPTDDILRRFFRTPYPERFEKCFLDWVRSFQLNLKDSVITAVGKTSRRSYNGNNKSMHLVNAFASEIGVILGQLQTEEKVMKLLQF